MIKYLQEAMLPDPRGLQPSGITSMGLALILELKIFKSCLVILVSLYFCAFVLIWKQVLINWHQESFRITEIKCRIAESIMNFQILSIEYHRNQVWNHGISRESIKIPNHIDQNQWKLANCGPLGLTTYCQQPPSYIMASMKLLPQ